MTASNLRAPHWPLTLWLAPCVCLPLILLFPTKAEPAQPAAAPRVDVVSAPPLSIAPPVVDAAPSVPATVHVVLTRGHQRLDLQLPVDGKVSPVTADAIARMMRCPTTGRTRRIATGTL